MKRLMLASGAGEVSSELFLKEGSRGSTSPRHRRRSERAPTKTFSKMIHRLKEGSISNHVERVGSAC
jgi:hypothetical protein